MISVKDGHVKTEGDATELAAELTALMHILIREHSAAFALAMAMTAESIDVRYHKMQSSCDNCRFRTTLTSCSYWSSIKDHESECTFWEEE